MTVVALFILIVLGIVLFPMVIPFLLSGYMAIDGIASRQFINDLKVSLGGTNIFLPDLLYAASAFLAVSAIFRIFLTTRFRKYAPMTRLAVVTIICYFLFFLIKFIIGYFDGVPLDSLVRRFAADTQLMYFFVPLFYIKSEETLKKLLFFVIVLTLIFPLVQPFLYGSADQVALQIGQKGTLRLGFGYANLLLMLGVLAFFVWEKKLWLSALPLAGIAMLAQRSAFVSLTLCVMVLAYQKKKSAKFIALMGGAGMLLLVALVVIQATTSVPVVDKAMERFSQTFEKTGSTEARILVIPIALREIESRPILGYSYHEIQKLTLKQDQDVIAFNMLHPHNFVLSSLLRTGLVGTLLLFFIIVLVLKSSWFLSKQKDTKEQGMYLFSATLFFVVFGVMNTSFFTASYVFWILGGVTFWYLNEYYISKKKPNTQQADQVAIELDEDEKPKNSRLLRTKRNH